MKSVIVQRNNVPEEVLEIFSCLFAENGFKDNTTVDYYPNGTKNNGEDYEVNRYQALKGSIFAVRTFWNN